MLVFTAQTHDCLNSYEAKKMNHPTDIEGFANMLESFSILIVILTPFSCTIEEELFL